MKVFGSIAYAHVPKELKKKLESKGMKCIFLGYSIDSNTYHLWCTEERKIIINKDVSFNQGLNIESTFQSNPE
jgi:hypothetical protein